MKLIRVGEVLKNGNPASIKIDDQFLPALKGIEDFSHLLIFWWISENEDKRDTLQSTPPFKNAPKMGIFASRSPRRPNLIGLTIVKLLQINIQQGILELDHMDAFEGTPIIDIKPYIPNSEHIKLDEVKVPDFFRELMHPREAKQ